MLDNVPIKQEMVAETNGAAEQPVVVDQQPVSFRLTIFANCRASFG